MQTLPTQKIHLKSQPIRAKLDVSPQFVFKNEKLLDNITDLCESGIILLICSGIKAKIALNENKTYVLS